MKQRKTLQQELGFQASTDRIWLPHGLSGIIIARNCCIGKNVSIFQHVTIAEANKHKTTVIEDGGMIGAGAVILNNAHVGKGAKIGANAVVTKDVPEGATMVGVPAKILNNYGNRTKNKLSIE